MSTFEASALRFRPQLFNQLVGQDFVVRTLTAEIIDGHISHAYLFSGPRGVGKTSAARLLAQAINYPQLLEDKTIASEDLDAQWHAIRRGNSVDIIEIDGASHTSVQDVLQIREEVQFAPQQLRYKAYIIDEVHMLSSSAFNALLKTIEEPPSYIVFIFATTEIHKVPATVRSRCQQFAFRKIPLEIIIDRLKMASTELQTSGMTDEILFWIATEASGSMRDAYTLFDQIVALGNDNEINTQEVFKTLGRSPVEKILSVAEQLATSAIGPAIEAFHTILESGVSVERFLFDLCECYRIVLLCLHNINDKNILRVNDIDKYAQLTNAYRPSDAVAILDECIATYRHLRTSEQDEQEIELCLAKIAYIRDRLTIEELTSELQDISSQINNPEQAPKATMTATATPAKAETPTSERTSPQPISTQEAAPEEESTPATAPTEAETPTPEQASPEPISTQKVAPKEESIPEQAPKATTTATPAETPADNRPDAGRSESTATATSAETARPEDVSPEPISAQKVAPEDELTPEARATGPLLDTAILSQVCERVSHTQEQIASMLSYLTCVQKEEDTILIYGRGLFECDMLSEQQALLEEQFSSVLQKPIRVEISVHEAPTLPAQAQEMIAKTKKYFQGEVVQK